MDPIEGGGLGGGMVWGVAKDNMSLVDRSGREVRGKHYRLHFSLGGRGGWSHQSWIIRWSQTTPGLKWMSGEFRFQQATSPVRFGFWSRAWEHEISFGELSSGGGALMTGGGGDGDSTESLAVAELSTGLWLCSCWKGAVSPAADWVLTQGCNSAQRKAEVEAEASGRSWEAVRARCLGTLGRGCHRAGRSGNQATPPLPAQARCGLLAVRSPAAGQRAGRRDPTWALDRADWTPLTEPRTARLLARKPRPAETRGQPAAVQAGWGTGRWRSWSRWWTVCRTPSRRWGRAACWSCRRLPWWAARAPARARCWRTSWAGECRVQRWLPALALGAWGGGGGLRWNGGGQWCRGTGGVVWLRGNPSLPRPATPGGPPVCLSSCNTKPFPPPGVCVWGSAPGWTSPGSAHASPGQPVPCPRFPAPHLLLSHQPPGGARRAVGFIPPPRLRVEMPRYPPCFSASLSCVYCSRQSSPAPGEGRRGARRKTSFVVVQLYPATLPHHSPPRESRIKGGVFAWAPNSQLQACARETEAQTLSRGWGVGVGGGTWTWVAQVPCHSCIISELTSIFLALSLRPLPQHPFPSLS